MKRGACVEIDLDALTHNLSVVRQFSSKAKIIAVIKANAYGHGMLSVARHLADKVDAMAVACVDEAKVLRDNAIQTDIVILQGFHNQYQLDECIKLGLQPVCHQKWQIDLLLENQSAIQLKVWLKVDTGMHRLGISSDEAKLEFERLNESVKVKEVCLMSHFANADEKNNISNTRQLHEFEQCSSTLKTETSLANSAALLTLPASIKDWVRPGIMLYGASPFRDKSSADFNLKPVMSLSSNVIAITQLVAGQSIGYGSTWTCQRDTQIAVVAIGYGDGYPRHAKNGIPVIINGHRCPLAGRVSMDMITVDITDLTEQVKIGDTVTLWGQELPVEEIANSSSTIAYELLCNTGKDIQ